MLLFMYFFFMILFWVTSCKLEPYIHITPLTVLNYPDEIANKVILLHNMRYLSLFMIILILCGLLLMLTAITVKMGKVKKEIGYLEAIWLILAAI